MSLDRAQLHELFEFRATLRRYLRWSEEQAIAAGLTPARHQLLLAIAGHEDPAGPTVTDIAESLLLRHHSAVGLIDRAAEAGLVERTHDPRHHRLVRLRLTPRGRARLDAMDAAHRGELEALRGSFDVLEDAVTRLELHEPTVFPTHAAPDPHPRAAPPPPRPPRRGPGPPARRGAS